MPGTAGLRCGDPQTVTAVLHLSVGLLKPLISALDYYIITTLCCRVAFGIVAVWKAGDCASLSLWRYWGLDPGSCACLARSPALSWLEHGSTSMVLEPNPIDSHCFGPTGRGCHCLAPHDISDGYSAKRSRSLWQEFTL